MKPNPLLVLRALAEARAILFEAGDFENIEEAVSPMLRYAETSGLVDKIDMDDVCAIINEPFIKRFKHANT